MVHAFQTVNRWYYGPVRSGLDTDPKSPLESMFVPKVEKANQFPRAMELKMEPFAKLTIGRGIGRISLH
jgi:hypothetical protein